MQPDAVPDPHGGHSGVRAAPRQGAAIPPQAAGELVAHAQVGVHRHYHALTHPLTITHPLTHSLTHLTRSLTHSLAHSPTHPLTHSLTHSPTLAPTLAPTLPSAHPFHVLFRPVFQARSARTTRGPSTPPRPPRCPAPAVTQIDIISDIISHAFLTHFSRYTAFMRAR